MFGTLSESIKGYKSWLCLIAYGINELMSVSAALVAKDYLNVLVIHKY